MSIRRKVRKRVDAYRSRLANWIIRGEIDLLNQWGAGLDVARRNALEGWAQEQGHARELQAALIEVEREAYASMNALIRIRDMETPSCAHIGKRMARIAREALGE